MEQRRRNIAGPVLIAASVGGIIWVSAGDLEPPRGPVTPTMKTLTQVEPRIPIGPDTTPGDEDSVFKITAIGSYYLTGNIFGAVDKSGIEIAASNVTLDLNGFVVSGLVLPPGQSNSGISVTQAGALNVTIRNGIVTSWGLGGINTGSVTGCRLENLVVSFNGTSGISAGNDTLIKNVVATKNGSNGIFCNGGCVVESCIASENSIGISVGIGATIRDCSANQNTNNGIDAFSNALIVDCNAFGNDGIGIEVGDGGTVTRCSANNNGDHGIAVETDCLVQRNTCQGNGTVVADGAGIHSIGGLFTSGNRIEGNNVNDNDIGISSTGDSFIISNTASDNGTAFVTTASDMVGQIFTVTNGSVLTTSNSWANFAN